MTLDEAIKHADEVAEEKSNLAVRIRDNMKSEIALSNADECETCADEHRQLAEWLRELKAYEEAEEEINRKMKSGQWSDAVVFGMGKALYIMRKHVKEVNADDGDSN